MSCLQHRHRGPGIEGFGLRAAALLGGVGEDAAYIADLIAGRMEMDAAA